MNEEEEEEFYIPDSFSFAPPKNSIYYFHNIISILIFQSGEPVYKYKLYRNYLMENFILDNEKLNISNYDGFQAFLKKLFVDLAESFLQENLYFMQKIYLFDEKNDNPYTLKILTILMNNAYDQTKIL